MHFIIRENKTATWDMNNKRDDNSVFFEVLSTLVLIVFVIFIFVKFLYF